MNSLVIISFLQISAIWAAPGVSDILSSSPTITPQLESALKRNKVANVFVTLKASTSSVLDTISHSSFQTRGEKLTALYLALQHHSQSSQQSILNYLSSRYYDSSSQRITVKSFWITNQIYIRNADISLISELQAQFSNLILSIDEEFFAHIIQPVSIQTNVSVVQEDDKVQWGVEKIEAPEAWKQLGESVREANGVVVATIDTGVRGTHEALRDNFVGDYGWFDPSGAASPTDNNGHGTHTMGTIAGSGGIGVAPQVQWAACRGCAGALCAQSHLLACGQFFVCPTLPNGSHPDCSKAPHVISNSWGGGRGNTWYNEVIDAWHVAGIIPVFSIGNAGPICSTPSSPGDQERVIAVGSTTNIDAISTFSSVGPTLDGRIKPEITAPGSNVVSAYHTDDNAYASISGTSMACPHVAGTIALLLIRNNFLSYEQAKDLLVENAEQNLRFTLRVCQGVRDNVFPNHVFGNGRINALKSIQAQSRMMMLNHERF